MDTLREDLEATNVPQKALARAFERYGPAGA